ncbi:hypothetical protein BJX61DRAFT_505607 [Aspergillus egyptiacus]|nr:hypothetical protein BJX61DRAFT_505607 [Aspergillus egyptiacus]
MASVAAPRESTRNPLVIPEIIGLVINNVEAVPDLLNSACVNSTWNILALKRLYEGSLKDMQFRTPDIASINCHFVASLDRFARNMSFVKHLLICPEIPTVDPERRLQDKAGSFEKCRALRRREHAELLFGAQGKGPESLTIPFEIVRHDWWHISDLLLTPAMKYLAIDNELSRYWSSPFFAALCPAPGRPEGKTLWPRLKALYLHETDDYWVDQLPKFKQLRILNLAGLVLNTHTPESVLKNIAKCRHLQVIDIRLDGLHDVEALLDLARACTTLKKLNIGHPGFGVNRQKVKDLIIGLVRVLPHLEYLWLPLPTQVDGSILPIIARHCPNLAVLKLSMTELVLSIDQMKEIPPLQRLESMRLSKIYVQDPPDVLKEEETQVFATQWRRIFPRLQGRPCAILLHMPDENSSRPTEAKQVHNESIPESDRFIFDAEDYHLRDSPARPWKALLEDEEELISGNISDMWQSNLETETIGWPVVSLDRYFLPGTYSTTPREYNLWI